MVEVIIFSIVLGVLAGLLSGLFGLGGGVIIVPALAWLFSALNYPQQLIMIMAVATSLATIIPTSISSIMSHQKLGNILWDRVFRLMPGILVGAAIGAIIADQIEATLLRSCFIAYLIYVATRMALSATPSTKKLKINKRLDYIAGHGIGLISSILGIGGGSLTVPYLVKRGMAMKNSVAVSSACGLFIALSGTLSYIILGQEQKGVMPTSSIGYIFVPSLIGIVSSSIISAPVGAWLATRIDARQLKRYFSIVLFLIALKMLFIQNGSLIN